MKSEVLLISETMKIEYFYDEENNRRNLAYIFTPSMNKNLEGNNFGGEVFFRNGYDTVAIKISNDDWFQSIPYALFEKINTIIKERGYENKIAYGSSMGGYASIALSKLLSCTIVVAISPQYAIDEDFDKRWSFYAKKINFKYRISKDSIKNDCKFFIFYDPKNPDAIQVRKLLEVIPINNAELIKLPYTGHQSSHFLAETGLIKDLIIKIANERSVDGINFLKNKRMSKFYFLGLSRSLLQKNHLQWALTAINSAILINGKEVEFHLQKSDVLDRLGRIPDAITSIKEAIKLQPNNSNLQQHLSKLLNRQEQ